MEDKKKYVPTLVVISVQELIKRIRVKADSSGNIGPTCTLSYIDENACGAWADGNDGPPGGGGSWGAMCIDLGPLFGCDEDSLLACNYAPVFK